MAERLPGVDAQFLYMETPAQHMHTLKIALVDTSSVPGGYRFDLLERELAARLHLLPPFRRRLLFDPLRLHHPWWVDDDRFDLRRQVRRVMVPAPGGKAEFERVVGDIASTPLDRRRPLWEMWICEGLADGRIGVVTKMHHAIADGAAANALLANVVDQTTPPPAPVARVPDPTPGRLLLGSLVERVRLLGALPALLARTIRSTRAVAEHRRHAPVVPPRPIFDTARTSFNGALTPRRSFATATLSLEDARRVRAAHGVTLNDVVLTVVSGAMRRWLHAKGEYPSVSLTAGVPIATDPKDAPPRLGGNRVSNLFTSLASDIDDPVERLHTVSAVTREAKQIQSLLGLDLLERWLEHAWPPGFAGFLQAYSRLHLAAHHRAPFNVVVSNVPGPTRELSVAGARLTDVFSVGPILEGIALNITVWSYENRLAFSAIACPDTLPDLPALVAELQPALDELLATVDAARPQAQNENVFL